MITKINELGHGFPLYVWEFIFEENQNEIPISIFRNDYRNTILIKMVNEKLKKIKIDIYYNDHGHPKYVHDSFGAMEIDLFKIFLVNQICKKNLTDEIYKISTYAFSIISKPNNCPYFIMIYKGISHIISKKTITIVNDLI